MQKEPGNFFDNLAQNPLFTTDEKIDKVSKIDLSSLNKGQGFIQTFKDSTKLSERKNQKQRNLEPKIKKKIATVKFKNKFLTKTNFYQDDVNIERVEMQIEHNAQLLLDEQEKKSYQFAQNLDINLELKKKLENDEKEKRLQNTFFQLSRNISTQKDKDIDIEITDEEVFEKSKIYENTINFVKKINEKIYDINDRLQNSQKKSPKKITNREQMKQQFFKQIRAKKNVMVKDPEFLKRFFVKKTYGDMQEEKDRRKKEKEQQEEGEEYDPNSDQEEQDEDLDEEEALLLQMEEEDVQDNQQDKLLEKEESDQQTKKNEVQDNDIKQQQEQESHSEHQNESEPLDQLQNQNKAIFNEQKNMEIEEEDSQNEQNQNQQRQFKNIKKIRDFKNEVKEQRRIANQKRKEQFQKEQKEIQDKYYHVEADLGSDNEEHDYVVKKINKNDIEEQEEGLDVTDEELVDQNQLEFDDNNEFEAHRQFLEHMIADDEQKIKEIMDRNFNRNDLEIEDINDRKERLKKNREFFQILMENNPSNIEKKLQEEDKQNKMHLYGVEIDQSELENNPNKNKITLEQFKRYMDHLVKKYQEKEMRKKKKFFQNNDLKFVLTDSIQDDQQKQNNNIQSFSVLQSRIIFNDSKTIKNNRVSN